MQSKVSKLHARRKIPDSPECGAVTIQYGFKRVTWSNHLEQDHHPAYPCKMRDEQWVQACWRPQLVPSVPEEIAFLFEVARGSMIYGLYFLPLASLAAEQCYRVLEAGARQRWKDLGLSKRSGSKKKSSLPEISFSEVIAALRKAGKIPQIDSDAWSVIPYLRNRYSHPSSQTIFSRKDAVKMLAYHVELLNRLFS